VTSIFHLVEPEIWDAATGLGEYRAESLYGEGFVHCSFRNQIEASANKWFRLVAELVAVELNPALIGAPVVVEDSYHSGTEFPHIYGPIPTAAAVEVHELSRDALNRWRMPAVAPD
jgi:uncharacterized protein (DUF952 family)